MCFFSPGAEATTTWDENKIYGCVCDSSWTVGLASGQTQQPEWFEPDCSLRRWAALAAKYLLASFVVASHQAHCCLLSLHRLPTRCPTGDDPNTAVTETDCEGVTVCSLLSAHVCLVSLLSRFHQKRNVCFHWMIIFCIIPSGCRWIWCWRSRQFMPCRLFQQRNMRLQNWRVQVLYRILQVLLHPTLCASPSILLHHLSSSQIVVLIFVLLKILCFKFTNNFVKSLIVFVFVLHSYFFFPVKIVAKSQCLQNKHNLPMHKHQHLSRQYPPSHLK